LKILKGRDNLKDLGVDVRVFKCILGKYGLRVWIGFIWTSVWSSGG
jgi:hypothetical protein